MNLKDIVSVTFCRIAFLWIRHFLHFLNDNPGSKSSPNLEMANLQDFLVISLIVTILVVVKAQEDILCRDESGNEITTCDKCLWHPRCEWCSQLSKGM